MAVASLGDPERRAQTIELGRARTQLIFRISLHPEKHILGPADKKKIQITLTRASRIKSQQDAYNSIDAHHATIQALAALTQGIS